MKVSIRWLLLTIVLFNTCSTVLARPTITSKVQQLSIIGTWIEYTLDGNISAYITFGENGYYNFTLSDKSFAIHGNWSISKDGMLIITVTGRDIFKATFKIEGDKLSMIDENGEKYEYQRKNVD